ncbi:MAG: aminopeptidase [Desulfuromonadales bacterium]
MARGFFTFRQQGGRRTHLLDIGNGMISQRKKRSALLRLFLGATVLMTLLSCGNLGYYARCTQGQVSILAKRRPIASLIKESDISPDVRMRLEEVLRIRDFASRELRLPDNGSYRSYVDLKRPYVVWNVVATPEFDLKPRQWCFPVAGCVTYRGFFSPEEATAFAETLQRQGDDVYLYGVSAYSTLGWFDDPVLNTFLNRPEEELAGLIFHELAHQKIYVKNDSQFNESFAKAVELEGVSRWLGATGETERIEAYFQGKERGEEFTHLVLDFQERLRTLYVQPLDIDTKRREKAALLAEMRRAHGELKASWGGYRGYDRWFAELNNAKMASVSTYHTHVPAFRQLLRQHQGDMDAFYREAESIGRLPGKDRLARLAQLTGLPLASLNPAEPRKEPETVEN